MKQGWTSLLCVTLLTLLSCSGGEEVNTTEREIARFR